MLFNRIKKLVRNRVAINTATANINSRLHQNKIITLTVATAQTLTLPKALGDGATYNVYIPVTATGNKIIKCIDSVDSFQGTAVNLPSANGAVTVFNAVAGTSDTITLNGTTTGGIRGTEVLFVSVAPGVWDIESYLVTSGTAATPFSATV